MCQKIKKERITKVEWYSLGGFTNSDLFRKQSRGGAWRYYRALADHRPQDTSPSGCPHYQATICCGLRISRVRVTPLFRGGNIP